MRDAIRFVNDLASSAAIGSSFAYEFRSPTMRTFSVPLPVGSLLSQSASRFAAFVRTPAQLPWPSPVSGASQALPLLLRWFALTTTRPPVFRSMNACAMAGRFRGPRRRR